MRDRRLVRSFLGWWVALTVLWWLLVFKTETAELVAGVIAGAVSAFALELVRVRGSTRFAFRPAWICCLAGVPREVLVETWWLVRVLARGEPIEGSIRCVPYAGARDRSPEGAGRRALAKWRGSVAPNTLVIGFAEQADVALVHQLVRTPEPPPLAPEADRT